MAVLLEQVLAMVNNKEHRCPVCGSTEVYPEGVGIRLEDAVLAKCFSCKSYLSVIYCKTCKDIVLIPSQGEV